jgi:benzoyl-CoA reductase/2-hydroxyglutaryl-CoA dehydratase subunit BcrC/BadD/HgdB
MCVRYKINNQRLSAVSHTTSFNVDGKYEFNLNFCEAYLVGASVLERNRRKTEKLLRLVTEMATSYIAIKVK